MNAKTQEAELEELFQENAKDYITYEKLVKYLTKQPSASTAKKVQALIQGAFLDRKCPDEIVTNDKKS